jgi:hypothetical protein
MKFKNSNPIIEGSEWIQRIFLHSKKKGFRLRTVFQLHFCFEHFKWALCDDIKLETTAN